MIRYYQHNHIFDPINFFQQLSLVTEVIKGLGVLLCNAALFFSLYVYLLSQLFLPWLQRQFCYCRCQEFDCFSERHLKFVFYWFYWNLTPVFSFLKRRVHCDIFFQIISWNTDLTFISHCILTLNFNETVFLCFHESFQWNTFSKETASTVISSIVSVS